MLGLFRTEKAQHDPCWAFSLGKKPSMDHAGLFPMEKSPAWIMWGLFRKQKETHIIRIMRDMLGFSTPHMSHAWFFRVGTDGLMRIVRCVCMHHFGSDNISHSQLRPSSICSCGSLASTVVTEKELLIILDPNNCTEVSDSRIHGGPHGLRKQ